MARLLKTGIFSLGMLALAMTVAGCEDEQAPQQQAAAAAPPPTPVVAVTVKPQRLAVETEYAGRTAGSREVEIRARVEGILLERTYKEGDNVKAGQVLFRIDPRPYEIALQRALARQQQAEASLRQAQRDLSRAATLFQRRAGTESARDDAQSAVELAQADVALANAEVADAQIDLDYTTVEAPIDGVTGREQLSEGSLVGTTADNSLLTTVTRLDPIYVNFAIPDAEWLRSRDLIESGRVAMAESGQIATALRLPDGRMYPQEGHVDFTDTTVDMDTGTIRARAVFPNPNGMILPGQFVRIILKGMVRTDAMVVPERAVMQGPQGPFVYRVDAEGKAQVAPVKTGPTVDEGWIIDNGLNAGDTVITEGVIKVRPGAPVAVEAGADEAGGAEAAANGEQGSGEKGSAQ